MVRYLFLPGTSDKERFQCPSVANETYAMKSSTIVQTELEILECIVVQEHNSCLDNGITDGKGIDTCRCEDCEEAHHDFAAIHYVLQFL